MRRLLLTAALVSCAGPTEPDDPAAPDAPGASGAARGVVGCADDPPTVRRDGGELIAETAHFRLIVRGDAVDEAEATTLAHLAESAREAWAQQFGAEPAEAGPFEAVLTPDYDAFAASILADGDNAPTEAGGFYSPVSGRAYWFVQPTVFYTRALMLHELTHQTHYATRASRRSMPFWYVEGVAEHLARHDWDGRCVTLGVRPLIEQEDFLAVALTELPGADELAGWVDDDAFPSRAAVMAWWRYLDRYAPVTADFQAWRTDADGGDALYTSLPDVIELAPLAEGYAAWLADHQSPLSPVFIEWLPLGTDRIDGFAELSSAARLKGPAPDAFTVTHAAPTGDGLAGVMVSYDDPAHQVLVMVNADGDVRTLTFNGDDVLWADLGEVRLGRDDVTWTVTWAGDTPTVTLRDQVLAVPSTFTPAGGLSLYGGQTAFYDLDVGSAP
jgi:hypothetical protein